MAPGEFGMLPGRQAGPGWASSAVTAAAAAAEPVALVTLGVGRSGSSGHRGPGAAPALPDTSTGIGCELVCRFNLPQKGQIPGGAHCVAWGWGGVRDPVNDARGAAVPRASMRGSCSLSLAITVLVKSVHALAFACSLE